MLDVMALIILVVLAVVAVVIAVVLWALPGRIATKREHPQSDAIRVCGRLGLLTLGLGWPLALVWAYTRPIRDAVAKGQAGGAGDSSYEDDRRSAVIVEASSAR